MSKKSWRKAEKRPKKGRKKVEKKLKNCHIKRQHKYKKESEEAICFLL